MDNQAKHMAQLSNIVNQRSSQDSALWSVFGFFGAANGILLVALFTQAKFPEPEVGIVLSLVGFLIAVVGALLQNRALGYIGLYEGLVGTLEDKLNISRDCGIKGIYDRGGLRARYIMVAFALIAIFGWLTGLGYFVYDLLY